MKRLAIGIDIGGTHTEFGLVDAAGNCLMKNSISTKKFSRFSDFATALILELQQLELPNSEPFVLVGIGVGAPAINCHDHLIHRAANLPWSGNLDLVERLKTDFSVPVMAINDANAVALAEMHCGNAKDLNNFMVITLGTGLGCGLVINKQLFCGGMGYAGELGHTLARPYGRQCGCGKYGCLETYVSATGIKRTISKLLAKYSCKSTLRGIPFNQMSAKRLATAAYHGDKIAVEAFEFTGLMLGMALSNMVAILNPEAIFLAGGLAKANDLILKPTQHHLEENLLDILKGRTKIQLSGVVGNPGIIGAALVVWHSIKKNDTR